MTTYPVPLERRFADTFSALLRRVTLLESRTVQIDSGTNIQTVTGVIDPAYTSGQPMVTLTGASSLSGPYQRLASYTPAPGDTVLMVPNATTYIVAGKLI